MSELEEKKESMRSTFAEFDIWDERDSEKYSIMQLEVIKRREQYLK